MPSVSPAYAGMIPSASSFAATFEREPRIRGDDPTGVWIIAIGK